MAAVNYSRIGRRAGQESLSLAFVLPHNARMPPDTHENHHGNGPEGSSLTRARVCIGCGYDLRGLPDAGDCPECGVAIERSVARTSFQFADPQWLKQMYVGIILIMFAHILFAGLFLLLPWLFMASADSRTTTAVYIPGALAMTFVTTLGAWRLGSPDPGLTQWSSQRRTVHLPRALRVLAGAFLINGLLLAATLIVVTDSSSPDWLVLALAGIVPVLFAAIVIVSLFHLRQCAAQADGELIRSTTNALWCWAIPFACIGLTVLMQIVMGGVSAFFPLCLLLPSGAMALIVGLAVFDDFRSIIANAIGAR